MEKNLMSMAKEVERLRAEVTGTEQIINGIYFSDLVFVYILIVLSSHIFLEIPL